VADSEHFVAAPRDRRLRVVELPLWICCVENALTDARRLSTGEPLETPSRDRRRRYWQLRWDVSDFYEFMRSSDEGGFLWIGSVFDALLGPDAFDMARFERTIEPLLESAEFALERLRRTVSKAAVGRGLSVQLRREFEQWPEWRWRRLMRTYAKLDRTYWPQRQLSLPLRGIAPEWDEIADAGQCTKAMSSRDVSGQDEGTARVLRSARGQGAKPVATRRKKPKRKQRPRRAAVAKKARPGAAA
jgi:hypothetical protein